MYFSTLNLMAMFFFNTCSETYCVAFVFYGETFIYQNSILFRGESVFIRTSANIRVSIVIYNSFLSLVSSHLIENNGWNSWCTSTVGKQNYIWRSIIG